MKRGFIISILAVSTLMLASCEQEQATQHSGDRYYPIFNGYMQFSTDVPTRAQLATDMRGKDFGVIGYQYSTTTNWATAKVLQTPSTFKNQKVSCADNGVCSYDIDSSQSGDQLKQWEEYKYSFFAYHPYNGDGITLSSDTATDTPTLTYTYPWYGKYDLVAVYGGLDATSDLMTAEAIDLDGSTKVNLAFQHRLFAVEVLVNNYNETTAEKNNSRKVSNMQVKVSGLANRSITIPMSTKNGEKITTDGVAIDEDITFAIQGKEVYVPAFNETVTDDDGTVRGRGVATSISKVGNTNKNGYLMLIPQSSDLQFTVTWNDPSIDDFTNIKNTLNSTMEFKAGKLYQIIINYVGSGITIAIIEAGTWDNQDVYHTFE